MLDDKMYLEERIRLSHLDDEASIKEALALLLRQVKEKGSTHYAMIDHLEGDEKILKETVKALGFVTE